MTDPATKPPSTAQAPAGGHAVRLASGSLLQQASQVTGLLAMFAIVTVLARQLDLSEFGVYGLLTSLAGYLLVIQNAAAGAAVRNMAAATSQRGRDEAFSTSVAVYALSGTITGLLVVMVGLALSLGVSLSGGLEHQAQLGSLFLGLVTALSWPITIYRDALRADQRFVRVAITEIVSLIVYAGLVLGLAVADASLWILIGASGSIPLLAGVGCAIVARWTRVPFAFGRARITRRAARELFALAGFISLTEAAATAIYALDRAILGLFKSAATVGLYEGPVRAHNLLRSLNAAISVTVLPAAARYLGEGDSERLRQLVVRGVRYSLALVVPLTVTGMVLAPDILEVWLGERFRSAGTAMAILMSYWLVNGATGVLSPVAVAAGRAGTLARYAWTVAIANVLISLALTPPLGLEGVVIGTAVPYLAAFPFFLRLALKAVTVPTSELVRESFLPAYSLGLALAAGLAALRLMLPPDTVVSILAIAAGGSVAYWLAFYVLWMRPAERRLVREVAVGFVPLRRRRGPKAPRSAPPPAPGHPR